MQEPVCIALDAMGGDHAPSEVLRGARVALERDPDLSLRVHATRGVGEEWRGILEERLTFVPCGPAPPMDAAASAARPESDNSVVSSLRDVRDGRAAGVVSAGSTGALAASAVICLGRLPGVPRPALAAAVPTLGSPCIVLDVGGTVDARPEWMVAFAAMGAAMARTTLDCPRPRVAVLNIGEESGKGDARSLALHRTLQALAEEGRDLGGGGWSFQGNVEGRGVFVPEAEVVVCDGFAGNVLLKTAEGVSGLVTDLLRQRVIALPLWRRLAFPLLQPAFADLKRTLDPAAHGGALLLGVQGLCVAAHGSSRAPAVAAAIALAARSARGNLQDRLARVLATLPAPVDAHGAEDRM